MTQAAHNTASVRSAEVAHPVLRARYSNWVVNRILAATSPCDLLGHHLECRVYTDGLHYAPEPPMRVSDMLHPE